MRLVVEVTHVRDWIKMRFPWSKMQEGECGRSLIGV